MVRPSRIPRARLHVVHRNPLAAFPSDSLLSQVREHSEAGEMVRVCRYAHGFYSVVKNDRLFLVLSAEGAALGTFDNVAAALLAGDRHVEFLPRVNGDDFPRGAA